MEKRVTRIEHVEGLDGKPFTDSEKEAVRAVREEPALGKYFIECSDAAEKDHIETLIQLIRIFPELKALPSQDLYDLTEFLIECRQRGDREALKTKIQSIKGGK